MVVSNRMGSCLLVGMALLGLLGCGATQHTATASPPPCAPGDDVVLAADLTVRCVVEDVWVFTALASSTFEYPRYPANGLIVEAGDHAELIDTAWTVEQASALLRWAREVRRRPITAAMVTHFHDDRVGGAPALNAASIPVFAQNETAALAETRGTPFVHQPLEPNSLSLVRWMYPGRGHSPENLVVFHEPSQTLFGGCFVKELSASTLGNVADADVPAWLGSIDLVIESYPELLHVVPGHGAPGGTELLAHTRALVHPPECTSDAECQVVIEALEPCACCNCVPPRAMSLAAIEAARSFMFSCEPVCEGECPACTTADELAHLVARCRDGFCAVEPIP